MLWIALHLPQLPLEALLRGSPSPEPVAIAAGHSILSCDREAAARGVRPGLGNSAALALAPQLRIRQRDAASETEALLGIAAWAAQFTPSVALEFPAVVLLEVSGSLKLFGGMENMLCAVREGLDAMGFSASLAAAPTARAATWFARAASTATSATAAGRSCNPPGKGALLQDMTQLRHALPSLPVALLCCDALVLDGLRAIGVGSMGDFLALPREGLARRFGQGVLDDLDRALGRAPDPRTFFMPPAKFSAGIELPAEVTQAEALLFAARRLLVQLGGYLTARSGGVQRISVKLFHRDAGLSEIIVGLVAPSRDVEHLAQLLRERLGNVVLREPVRSIAIEADAILPLPGRNLGLFPDEAGAPGNWEKLIERLRARLGNHAVHGVSVHPDHRPERVAVTVEPGAKFSAAAPRAQGQCPATGALPEFGRRPFWLLEPPRPIREVGAVPHYEGPLELLAGPERIESGWWDDDDVVRDYFIARTRDESLLWIFRERHGRGGWYLHGLFA